MAKTRKVYFLKGGMVRFWSVRWNRYMTEPARLIKDRDLHAMSCSDAARCRSWSAATEA